MINLDPDPSKRMRHFPDVNAAIEYAEDSADRALRGSGDQVAHDRCAGPPAAGRTARSSPALVRSRLVPRSYRDAEPVVLAGQPPHGLFLVLSGMVDVSAEQEDVRHHLSMFTVGTTFGTIYAVTQRGYDIDAHARDDVEALLLPMDGDRRTERDARRT